MTGRVTYVAYGLCLRPNFPLPFLPEIESKADLTVLHAGRVAKPAEPPPYPSINWQKEGSEWVWEYRDNEGIVFRFRLNTAGDTLSLQYSQAEMRDIFPFLMGPGLGAVLHRRGMPLLHGASVLMEAGAILVSGLSGMGKSTLTAALVAAGRPLITEDLTPLAAAGAEFLILPGYPGLQLHADAALALGYNLDDCPKVYPGFADEDKHWLDVTRLPGGFHAAPAPLRLIYLLSGRRAGLNAPEVEPLPPMQACLALPEHLYGRRWLDLPPQPSLSLCARLAERVMVRRVWLPEGLDTVAATAQALIADAQAGLKSLRPA